MTDQEILRLLKESLVRVAPSRAPEFDQLDLGARLDELALESITTLELVNVLEQRLGTTFGDDDLVAIRSLRDVITLIRRSVENKRLSRTTL